MRPEIKPPTTIRRVAPKAMTGMGEMIRPAQVTLARLKDESSGAGEIKPPTVVRRVAAKASTEMGDQFVPPQVRLNRLRKAGNP